MAYVPVIVGANLVETDADGRFNIAVPPASVADISSGLPAVKYEEIAGVTRESLPGTGLEISEIAQANGGLILINASQRVKPQPLCYVEDPNSGAGFIRFPFTNRSGVKLTVESDKLNYITSLADPSRGPDQEPYPLADFDPISDDQPDGYLGFEWPLRYFVWFDTARNSEIVSAEWKLINESASLDQPLSDVPLCESAGLIDSCNPYTTIESNRLYSQMFSTVTRLSQLAERAAKKGIWRNRTGKFRNPFLSRGATSLRTTKQLLNGLPNPGYLCPAALPTGCSYVAFPKGEITRQFDLILKVKLPPELKFLIKTMGQERNKFLAALRAQPNQLIRCNSTR